MMRRLRLMTKQVYDFIEASKNLAKHFATDEYLVTRNIIDLVDNGLLTIKNMKHYFGHREYKIYLTCISGDCSNFTDTTINYPHLYNLINQIQNDIITKDFNCDSCYNKIIEQKHFKLFVQNYLKPESHLFVKPGPIDNIVHHFAKKIKEYVHEHFAKDKKTYYKTPLWYYIADKIKTRDLLCQMCNSEKNLNAHHIHYENFGAELTNLNDLITVCNNCHQQHHSIY